MKHTKGFTLVELLVVISIIGILVTIVLASLTRSRMSAKDAVVMQSLNSYRTQVEIDFEGNYNGLCTSGNESLAQIEDYIESQGGELFDCNSDSRDYVIAAVLPSGKEELLLGAFAPEQAYAQKLEVMGGTKDPINPNGGIKNPSIGDSEVSGKLNGYCINSRGSSKKISLEEFKLLPKTIRVISDSEIGTQTQEATRKISAETMVKGITAASMLNPFCTIAEVEAYQGGGQNNSPYKRICYDLENPDYTKTGCINVIDDKPVDPVLCDKARIEPLECEGDFDPSQYQNVCLGKSEPYITGCAENDPKTGQPAKSVDAVFCKGLPAANCTGAQYAAQCIDKVFTTGCVELDAKGNSIKPVDNGACIKAGITPSKEACTGAQYAAQCIDKVFNTGCVELDAKGNSIKPVDNGACIKAGITPSKEACMTSLLAPHCINSEFNTGCVEIDGKGNPIKPVSVDQCKKAGIVHDTQNCIPEGDFQAVCPTDKVPFQTGCVEDKKGTLYQVDVQLCKDAGVPEPRNCEAYEYRCNPGLECVTIVPDGTKDQPKIVDNRMCEDTGVKLITCNTGPTYKSVCKDANNPAYTTGCAEVDAKGFPIKAVDLKLCEGLPLAQCK